MERVHTVWHWTQQVSQGSGNRSAQKGKPAGEKQSINKSEWHMQPDCLLCWQLMPSLLLDKSSKHASLVISSLLLWIASILSWLTASVSWYKKACCPQLYWWRQSLHSQNVSLQPLICFGTLQSSNCVINTLLAQLERLSAREVHHYVSLLSIKAQTRERESQDLLNLHRGSAMISDVPLNRTTRSAGLRCLSWTIYSYHLKEE